MEIKVNPVGTVVASPPGRPHGSKVEYNPPSGGRAISQTDVGGAFTADLSGSLASGRPNEPYVIRTLIAALRARGHKVERVRGARDEDGDDQFLVIDGQKVSVQAVTMPADDTSWKSLKQTGVASRQGDLNAAVALVREALIKKANSAKGTLVALDAAHVGAVVGRDLVDAYLRAHPDPVAEFKFKDVWIVGPTMSYTVRLAAPSP